MAERSGAGDASPRAAANRQLETPEPADALDPPRAYGPAPVTGVLRARPGDFRVDELPLCAPDGDGEHVWLQVRKQGANTQWVAAALARHAGVAPLHVGFAGLKDRNAVTTQWFSVGLGGRPEPDWERLAEPGVEVLQARRARTKLRRGDLSGNRFVLRVTALAGDLAALAERLERVARHGVPNYFGEQRFGHGGANVEKARAMFEGRLRVRDRHRRGLYLSAARSLLFNRVLAWRVRRDCWSRAVPGDRLVYDDGGTSPVGVDADEGQRRELAARRCHPSGPLWGRGRAGVDGDALVLESEALAALAGWRDALEHAGLAQERRALRLVARDLRWQVDVAGAVLELGFALPAGAYATVVLRELVNTAPAAASCADPGPAVRPAQSV